MAEELLIMQTARYYGRLGMMPHLKRGTLINKSDGTLG